MAVIEKTAVGRDRSVAAPTGAVAVTATLVLLVMVLAAVDITQGTADVGGSEVWDALTGNAAAGDSSVVIASRLPRMVAAVLVGVALGTAGAALRRSAGTCSPRRTPSP